MDIGGEDIVIETNLTKDLQRKVMDDYMQSLWNHVEIMVGNDNGNHDTIFYYRNIKAYESWSDKGRTNRNSKNMVMFIMEDKQCTVVHESLDEDSVRKAFE
jgi:hypothetical protein